MDHHRAAAPGTGHAAPRHATVDHPSPGCRRGTCRRRRHVPALRPVRPRDGRADPRRPAVPGRTRRGAGRHPGRARRADELAPSGRQLGGLPAVRGGEPRDAARRPERDAADAGPAAGPAGVTSDPAGPARRGPARDDPGTIRRSGPRPAPCPARRDPGRTPGRRVPLPRRRRRGGPAPCARRRGGRGGTDRPDRLDRPDRPRRAAGAGRPRRRRPPGHPAGAGAGGGLRRRHPAGRGRHPRPGRRRTGHLPGHRLRRVDHQPPAELAGDPASPDRAAHGSRPRRGDAPRRARHHRAAAVAPRRQAAHRPDPGRRRPGRRRGDRVRGERDRPGPRVGGRLHPRRPDPGTTRTGRHLGRNGGHPTTAGPRRASSDAPGIRLARRVARHRRLGRLPRLPRRPSDGPALRPGAQRASDPPGGTAPRRRSRRPGRAAHPGPLRPPRRRIPLPARPHPTGLGTDSGRDPGACPGGADRAAGVADQPAGPAGSGRPGRRVRPRLPGGHPRRPGRRRRRADPAPHRRRARRPERCR
ncbi:hypothetical protein C5N14_29310 [Micromonospora sp. MW-13]|nr:hypothetical protein C5N14_29310 [Micromonospora sp. MW-13]